MEPYDQSASSGLIAVMFGILLIPLLIVWLISVIGMWKTFEKAGKPGWSAIIPIYNIIVWLEIIGKPMWWLLMLIIPCVNIIFAVWMTNLMSKSFGQSEGFTIGLILLPFIFWPILGFGNYHYAGPAGAGLANRPGFDPSNDYRDPFNNTPPPQV